MNTFKRTALGLAIITATATSFVTAAEDSKLDKLSVSGFIDMSAGYVDTDGASSDSFSGLDQVEIDVSYDFGNKLKAFVDVEYQNEAEGVDVEQAYITYDVSSAFMVKAGRFLSYSGWETEEPTGLYQYSGAGYAGYFYGGYQQGVSAMYSSDKFAAAVSIVNDLAAPLETDSKQVGVETMLAFMPTESTTIKGFYSVEGDKKLLNLWASYAMDALTLAVEYNTADDTAFVGSEADGYLLMANYAFETFALTVRYADYEVENSAGVTVEDKSSITIAPSFSVNDNLAIIFEYRMDKDEIGSDSDSIALEALITF